jgi:hypothetical protein
MVSNDGLCGLGMTLKWNCQFTSILYQCTKQSLVRQVECESGLGRL